MPSDTEWTTLINYLGGDNVAGGKMKTTGTTYWNDSNRGAKNESGFSVLPGGYRNNNGSFYYIRSNAFFWSATENDDKYDAWYRTLGNIDGNVFRGDYMNILSNKSVGSSVRCLTD